MAEHFICLTIDIDPDELSGNEINRFSDSFSCFELIQNFPDFINQNLGSVPITWFVRIDNQIAHFWGSPLYLLNKYEDFWSYVKSLGHEIGWHPHLYKWDEHNSTFEIETNILNAQKLLKTIHNLLKMDGVKLKSFRNGEGWQHPILFDLIEEFGFCVESSVIPGRIVAEEPLKSWVNAPNHTYFPSKNNLAEVGLSRSMLECPMSSWLTKAPYDKSPRIRYINPAIHNKLFVDALKLNPNLFNNDKEEIVVWNFISHPADIAKRVPNADLLYNRSYENYANNIEAFVEIIQSKGDSVNFATLSNASEMWRKRNENKG